MRRRTHRVVGATAVVVAVAPGASAQLGPASTSLEADLRRAAAAVTRRPGATPAPSYPAPTTMSQVDRWPTQGYWRVQRPGDPRSPRNAARLIGPADGARSLDDAFRVFVRASGITLVGQPRFEPLEAWRHTNGSDIRFALAETRLAGEDGVAAVYLARQPRDGGKFMVLAIETTRGTFVEWGGVTRVMRLRNEIPSMNVFPPERRAQIANAPLPRQVAFYEAALNRLYANLSTQLMASQLAVTQQMTQMNYNLLFGKQITDPAWKSRPPR